MLDVHPPHSATHTWRDFFLHIATIVVGLLIAVGLEQIVEYAHHRHQLGDLREQMRDVLEKNRDSTPYNMEIAARLRASFQSIQARIATGGAQAAPPLTLPAVDLFPRVPSIAPYEAAKENGTVALLTSEEIRIYNRLALAARLPAAGRSRAERKLSRPRFFRRTLCRLRRESRLRWSQAESRYREALFDAAGAVRHPCGERHQAP